MHRSSGVFRFIAGFLACAAFAAQAQLAENPDWKEAEVPPPPALQVDKLLPLEIGARSVLQWGIDPASIRIGGDGVVRYVIVARGEGGGLNAFYEGVRCSSLEVKQYARSNDGQWTPVAGAEFKPMQGSAARLHSLFVARNGACIGQGPNRSPEAVARDLTTRSEWRFRPEIR
jgi:hypothetical protein